MCMEPDPSPLLVEHPDPQIAVLRLNRPERLNAVSLPLYNALRDELNRIKRDHAIRAVVITGEGRAFSVGADLKSHAQGQAGVEERKKYVETGQGVYQAIQNLPQPVVAAVNGHAVGAGIELALSCDLIVAAREAKMRLPEVGLGTFVGGGTVYTLAGRVGLGRAKEIVMLGDFFYASDEIAQGLFTRVVSVDEVVPVAIDLARKLAAKAPVSLRLAKELLNGAQRMGYDEALTAEGDALIQCMGTKDWVEGIRAFHDKREPKFKGE